MLKHYIPVSFPFDCTSCVQETRKIASRLWIFVRVGTSDCYEDPYTCSTSIVPTTQKGGKDKKHLAIKLRHKTMGVFFVQGRCATSGRYRRTGQSVSFKLSRHLYHPFVHFKLYSERVFCTRSLVLELQSGYGAPKVEHLRAAGVSLESD